MLYKQFIILVIHSLLFTQLYAISCSQPEMASDNLINKFKYGCFCGKNYPNIKHPSKKNYTKLNRIQRQELIALYQQIEAYDDIDKACKAHDICYISHGNKAKICNDSISKTLYNIEKKFDTTNKETHKQCKNLAYDISSVFNTIFSPAQEDDGIFDLGKLLMNGAVTVANKMLQETVDTLNPGEITRYPLANQKCLLKDLKN